MGHVNHFNFSGRRPTFHAFNESKPPCSMGAIYKAAYGTLSRRGVWAKDGEEGKKKEC